MILLILLGVITALAFYIRHVYTFWQRKGFPIDVNQKVPFGAMDSIVKRQRSFGMAINDVYKNNKDRFLGIYLFFRPAILVRDAELAHQMLVQDFPSFHDRGVYCDEENDPYSGNLFNLQGERWKSLRTKLAPSFTSGKLKSMFDTIDDVGNKMLDYLDKNIPDEGEAVVVEMKELFSKYAIDIIGSVIFGIEVDSFKDPNNALQQISKEFTTPSFATIVRGTAAFLFPALQKLFVRLHIPDPSADAFKDMVRQTVEFREKNNYYRKDMMQMLIELRNTGKINLSDDIWKGQTAAENLKSMSIDCIAGQAFLFYVAGFDSTSATTAFTIFELAKYPEILTKVQKDIENSLAKHNGLITYESIQDMKYLDLCVMETIRKYPALPILNRECTIDFPVPGSDKIIKKGTPIVISLFGIQRDPEYFPDPLKYEPERFLEESKNYNPIAYMPFGEGPRHCIAQRLGKINVKVALAKFLMHYDIENAQEGEIEIDNFAVTIVPKGGVNLKLRKKKNASTK